MIEPRFMIGQRWISETEAELGLGIVMEVSSRQLTLSFPAAGERRTYALKTAPVSRVRYRPGERVQDQDGLAITVAEVLEQNGCLAYRGRTRTGEEVLIPEFELDSFVQFSSPRERLFAGQVDRHQHFTLRYQTLNYQHRHRQSAVFGLAGPRVQLLPHQLYIADEVSRRAAPRVLLADEVGLGKTIEAGLILHRQLLTGQVRRALVVVPASLQHQWLVEMLRRFNLGFTLLDEERCNSLFGLDDIDPSLLPDDEEIVIDEADDNPFESAQLVLCSLGFLADNPERLQQACEAGWDMLLVDEAHHLKWSETAASDAYLAIERLALQTPALLLLTATPEQLGVESHFARLRLLDPDRYHDLQQFLHEQDNYGALNDLVQSLLALQAGGGPFPAPAQRKALAHYLPPETLAELEQLDDASVAVTRAVALLLDRHGTGRVLFRNTRASVSGFPRRELHPHPLEVEHDYQEPFARTPFAEQLQPEVFWAIQTGSEWWLQDPRVTWLAEWLRSMRRRKVLVICASADTAQSLELYLRLRRGLATAVFHEGLSLIERDRAAAYFADDETGAQVLVCSEIGSEGRNFQFSQDLVLFDLPLNPDLLEQRIGRLDRIGQSGDVRLHVPYYRHSAQEVLLRWYHEALNAFEQTCAIGQLLFQRFGQDLVSVGTEANDKKLDDLLQAAATFAGNLREQMQSGRDRLLELNSCKPERAAHLQEELQTRDKSAALTDYLERLCDCFGIDCEDHGDHSLVLRPGDHMRVDHFPGLLDDGMTVTLSRQQALSREDMHFLSWEHPLLRGAEELVSGSSFGNTAVCTLKLPPLKPGTLLLEALFVLHCPAPAHLQLPRFLPQSLLRVLLDNNGKDLSRALEIGKLTRLLQKVPRTSAQELVRHARAQLMQMTEQAEALVAPRQAELVAEARLLMTTELEGELSRLRALAAVNPNVRTSEIEALEQRLHDGTKYLGQAKLRLDALRVIMTV